VNNDGYAEFFDTLAYLRTYDANAGCGGGGPALPGGITVNMEAWRDAPGDGTWDLASPGTDVSRVWTFGGNLSPETVTDGPSQLIAAAYRFPAAAASGADYEDPSRSPSSIELWFNADNTAAEQVLWEAGGGARGAAFTIAERARSDSTSRTARRARPSQRADHDRLAPGRRHDQHQHRAISLSTSTAPRSARSTPARPTAGRAATRPASGQVTSSMVGNLTPAPFNGRIAIYRFYNNRVLSPAQVDQAYRAVIEASTPCDPAADLDGNGIVDSADIEMHIINLIGCE
jgi:hypothetical protein